MIADDGDRPSLVERSYVHKDELWAADILPYCVALVVVFLVGFWLFVR